MSSRLLRAVLAILAAASAGALALSIKYAETVYVQVSPLQGLAASEKRVIEGLVDGARRTCIDLTKAWVIVEAEGSFSETATPEALAVKSLLVAHGLAPENVVGGSNRVAANGMKSTSTTTLVKVNLACTPKA